MKAFIKSSLSAGEAKFTASIGLLLMRLFLGGVMLMNHGLDKFAKSPDSLPNPMNFNPTFNGYLVLLAEVLCAGLLLVGLASRWAAATLCIAMSVAFFIFHEASLKDGELALAYLVGYAAILIIGPGLISVDKMIGKK